VASKKVAGVIAGLSLVLGLVACGGDDDATGSEAAPSTAVAAATTSIAAAAPTTEPAPTTGAPPSSAPPVSTSVTAPTTAPADVPTRIVSLSPTHTEILFAIGAGDQIVAVDNLSTYPPEAAPLVTELSGFEPNVEAVAGYEPDLVVTEGTNPDFVAQLDSLGLPYWEGPAPIGFSDVYAQIEELGAVTGHVDEAAQLAARMQADIDAIIASMPPLAEPLSVYHELDNTYFSVTSDTFIGQVYNRLGLRNIADEAEGTGGAYPQLNAEFIISTNPDLIFLADTKCCGESAETVAGRPGWAAITAVANGAVVEMDDDIASRWGPRIVDYMRAVADAVQRVAAGQ
jgi:iron complex transport system substrate-binding protein